MSDQFLHVPLADIVVSLTNPRTSTGLDNASLAELAEDIKRRGVDTPITLRPLPGARVADTTRNVKYEIVAGERRLRSSLMAGVTTIPARVRDLNDVQALEVQLAENLHREDLSPLEEAKGIRRLMDEAKITADEVAVRMEKSRTHVYNRLKLLDLGTEGQTALREGKIEASVAMLVARIPDGKQQAKALKQIIEGSQEWIGGQYIRQPLSFRAAQAMVQDEFMLKLSDARFKITVADLVPGVVSCKECPNRTGANPDLFHNVKSADVCTDPPCFHKKEEAAAKLLVKEAEAKGQTVIAGKEAEALRIGYGSSAHFKGYKRLDESADSPTKEPLRKIIGKLMDEKGIKPTLLEHPTKKGQLVAALPNDVANTLLKEIQAQAKADKKAAPAAVQDLLTEKASQEKARLDAKFHREVRAQIIAETWDEIQRSAGNFIAQGSFTLDIHRHLASHAAWSLDADGAEAASKLLNTGSVGAQHGLRELVKKHPRPDLLHLLLIMHNRSGEGHGLVTKAVHGDDIKAVTKRIEAEVKDRVYPKPEKKAPTANAPAAQAKAGAGGKAGAKGKPSPTPARAAKISAEQAKQGIADALQGIEEPASAPKGAVAPAAVPAGKKAAPAWPFPIAATKTEPTSLGGFSAGQAVRITTNTDKLRLKHNKYSGKLGTVTGIDIGGKELDVKVGRDTRCFEPGELEMVS